MRVRIGGRIVTPVATEAPIEVVEHALAAAKLEALVTEGETEGFGPSRRRDVIALARKHRLASPFTALVVLESAADRGALRGNEARREMEAVNRVVYELNVEREYGGLEE